MKPLSALFAAALVFPLAATAANITVKSAFDRAEVAIPESAPWLPDATTFRSALDLDATFNGNSFNGTNGIDFYDGNSGGDDAEYGIRTFLSRDSGYAYLVGRHVRSSGAPNDAFIVRITPNGSPDSTFGNNGKMYVSVPFPIADVAMDPSGIFYFTGPIVTPPFTDKDFAVYCVVDDGTPCDGFGTNGLAKKAIDINGQHDDVPWGIVYDALGSVFVFGFSNTAASGTNEDVAVVKFNATTGGIKPGFGNHGGAAVLGFDLTANGSDIPYAALLTYPASPTGAYRLYVAGSVDRGANDTDGFVIALDPSTGAYDTAFHNDPVIVHTDLGTTIKFDTFTSMTELHDGHLLLAGYAQDDAGDEKLMLAKLNAAGGGKDTSFCGGGSCVNELIAGTGALAFPLSHFVYTRGIAERPGNHDLVLSLTVKNDVFSGSDGHVYQEAVEIGPSGNSLRTWTALDYAATSTPRDSYTNSILVDNDNRVLITGSRQWNSATSDWDMTLARLVDTDTIFVNSFEAH